MSACVHAHTLLLQSQRTNQEEHHAAGPILYHNRWSSGGDLDAAAIARPGSGDEQRLDVIRWIRSCARGGGDGSAGPARIYGAASPEATRRYPSPADLAVGEIVAIPDTVIVRADPASV